MRTISSTEDARKLAFPNGGELDPQIFDKVWKPLNEAKGMKAELDEVLEAFKKLEQNVREISESRDTTTSLLTIKMGKSLDPGDFDKVEKLLNEAKGLYETGSASEEGGSSSQETQSEEPEVSKVDEAIAATRNKVCGGRLKKTANFRTGSRQVRVCRAAVSTAVNRKVLDSSPFLSSEYLALERRYAQSFEDFCLLLSHQTSALN